MLPELLSYDPRVRVEFLLSLPQNLITFLRLLQAVNGFEGLSEWVCQTAADLPKEFQDELALLSYAIRWCFRRQDSLLWCLPADHTAHLRWEDFQLHLKDTPAAEYRRVLLLNLAQEAQESNNAPSDPSDAVRRMVAAVRRMEREKWGPYFDLPDEESLVRLIQVPRQLKDRLINLLSDSWQKFYKQDFEKHREVLTRVVDYHRQQTYPRDFTDLFQEVTGQVASWRILECVQKHLQKIECVIFSPCAHLGPFLQLTITLPTLVVAFDYQTSSVQKVGKAQASDLLLLLKSLGDESRLKILSLLQEREMYAQEIVDAVGLSQPTVSRHLQLLQRAGVVTVRQIGSAKFYSINREKGRSICDTLRHIVG